MEENRWETYSEEMEDDDLAMDVEDMEDEDEDMSRSSMTGSQQGSRQPYFEELSSKMSGAFRGNPVAPMQRQPMDYHSDASSPMHSFGDIGDEKNEAATLLMQMEKTIVHQKFVNDFQDDFDEEDLA